MRREEVGSILRSSTQKRKKRTISWQAGGVGRSIKERGQPCKKAGKMIGEIFKDEGIMVKAPPCPERSMKTPLPQQSSSSTREEESQWISVEDRRKRRVAFEQMAKRTLGYLETLKIRKWVSVN